MRRSRHPNNAGFTLLELLMAMGLFTIAAVSLANAINLISLSVSESVEEVDIRQQLRGVLIEESRNPNLEEGKRSYSNAQGTVYEVEVSRLELQNRDAESLEDIYEVKVTARREIGGQKSEIVDTADTWVFKRLFSNQ